MFNVSQLRSIPQFLRANSYKRAFITMKEKNRDPRFFNYPSYRILTEKYKHPHQKLTNGLFLFQYRVANLFA